MASATYQVLEIGQFGHVVGLSGDWDKYNNIRVEIISIIEEADGLVYNVRSFNRQTNVTTNIDIYPENFIPEIVEKKTTVDCFSEFYADEEDDEDDEYEVDEYYENMCLREINFELEEKLSASEEELRASEEELRAREEELIAVKEELRALKAVRKQQDALKASSTPFNYAVTPSAAPAHVLVSTGVKDVWE